MIRIMLYTLLDETVCTIETDHENPDTTWPSSVHWSSLAYVKGPLLAHDEDQQVVGLVEAAVNAAHRRAAERGGWSLLA